jgi:alpha-N-arabinofuranosidase
VSDDGRKVYASRNVSGLAPVWKKFEVTLRTWGVTPTAKTRFQITLQKPGTVWLGFVSLFPPTWNNRPNGLRKDLMQMLVDLNPKFLRFPGGNYLEGDTIETRFDWKKTLGPLEERPGLPLDRWAWAAGIPGVVRRHESGAGAGGLRRLLAQRRSH